MFLCLSIRFAVDRWCQDPEDVTDENATQSLRYDQFIAPLVKAVQELSAEVETLKTKVAALEDA